MEPLGRDLARFLQLLQSFKCQNLPCDLLIRACESRPTWSSTGEIIDRFPLEAGVSEWLVDFYNANKPFLHGTTLESCRKYIKYTTGIDGVAYLEMTSEGQHELQVVDERDLARERITIILQAFPSINSEIIGEEIIDRLMHVVKSSILPLLSSLTRTDIEAWLLPKALGEREPFGVSMVEFLYQVIDRLGVENPLIPLPFLRQLLNVIANQKLANISIVFSKISQILDAYDDNNALQSSSWVSGTRTDQRSNALTGHTLAMILSNGASKRKPKALTESLAEVLSDWAPLSVSQPSTMEYLAATSFCNRMQINIIGKPSLVTVDSIALQGLLLSRRKQHKDATEFLTSTIGVITSQYGPCSMQLGIVRAELANCYNILRQEEKAESCVITTLHGRDSQCVSTRRDGVYLRLALADSLIGRARYNEAMPVLESIIGSPDVSAKFRMMSLLRQARSRRRMHEDAQAAFEENSSLWTGVTLLRDVPVALSMEYVEELACTISELPKRQLRDSDKTQQLVEAVDSILGGSSYVIESPCWEWYAEAKQKYLGQVVKASRVDKGKEKDDGSRNKAKIGLGTPILSPASSRTPAPADGDKFHATRAWSKKLILSFDGGAGVHAFSSLLILRRIMHEIRQREISHDDGPAYSRSSHLSDRPATWKVSGRVDEFLPCHYFDYVVGGSTGGLNSIMLGRLRMSVDEAIDNFIDYANAVFSHPQQFQELTHESKYSSAKAREAFIKIIANSEVASKHRVLHDHDAENIAEKELFIPLEENERRTRTMVKSCYYRDKDLLPYIWKSFKDYKSKTQPRNTKIWEVACATSATLSYFDPAEIGGDEFFDRHILPYKRPMWAVEEIRNLHTMISVLFVNLGTGVFGETRARIGRNWRQILNLEEVGKRAKAYPKNISYDRGFLDWNAVARGLRRKSYTLSVEGHLHNIPYDDWRPPISGKETLQDITNITEEYLDEEEVRQKIKCIANEAVRIRRARARTDGWKHFV